jgi:tetratricopeptide (TPR) repeat protein
MSLEGIRGAPGEFADELPGTKHHRHKHRDNADAESLELARISKLRRHEQHVLKSKQKKTRKRQKELYKVVTAQDVAPATGRSLAMQVVANTAKAALEGDHHVHNGEDSDSDKGFKPSGRRPLPDLPNSLDPKNSPWGFTIGLLVATKKFLLTQQMKLVITKVKGGQLVFSLIDPQFREFGLLRTELQIFELFSLREQHRVKQLEREKKIKLIVDCVNFSIIKGRKTMCLTLPSVASRNLHFMGTSDDFDKKEERKIVKVKLKFKAAIRSMSSSKDLFEKARAKSHLQFLLEHSSRVHGDTVDIEPARLPVSIGGSKFVCNMKLVRGELDIAAVDSNNNVWLLCAPLRDVLALAVEQKILQIDPPVILSKAEIFTMVADQMLSFDKYSDGIGAGIRFKHEGAESTMDNESNATLDIKIEEKTSHKGHSGWMKAKLVANKINESKYANMIRSEPFNPAGYVALGKMRLKRGQRRKGLALIQAALRLPHVDLQKKPFDGLFWKMFVNVLYRPRPGAILDDVDLDEAKNAFVYSLRFFQNLTNPDYLLMGGKIMEERGDITNALQVYSKVIQNFPSYEKLTEVVFRAAMCSLHNGSFKQSASYFEYILMDPLPPYTKLELILLASSCLCLDGQSQIGNNGYKHVFQEMRRKHGKSSVYNFQGWEEWAGCRDVWLDLIKKSTANKHWLLANDLYRKSMSFPPALGKVSNLSEANLWWSAAQTAYKSRDMHFALECCRTSLQYDSSNAAAIEAGRTWTRGRSGTPHHDSHDVKYNVLEEFFDPLEMPVSIKSGRAHVRLKFPPKNMKRPSTSPDTRRNQEKLIGIGSSTTTHIHAGYRHNFRPLSASENHIVQRLFEGASHNRFDRIVKKQLQTQKAKFEQILSCALEVKTHSWGAGESRRSFSGTSSLGGRPHTTMGRTRQTSRDSGRQSQRPKTAEATSRLSPIEGVMSPEESASPSKAFGREKMRKVDLWGYGPNTTGTNSATSTGTSSNAKSKQSRRKSARETKSSSSTNLHSVSKELKKGKSKRPIRRRRKKTKRRILASSLGVPVAYTKGSVSGIIPDSVFAKPNVSITQQREAEVKFFKRLNRQSREKRKMALNYLKTIPKD